MNKSYLPENLYRLRKRAGLSQEEFADRLKVSRQAISKWERGEAYPDTENLIAISRLFSVTIDDLINCEDITAAAPRPEREVREKSSDKGCADRDGVCSEDYGADDADGDADEDEDYDADEDDASQREPDEAKKRGFRAGLSKILYSVPYAVVVTGAFLAIGFLADGWDWSWTLFITIPVYYSLVDVISKRRLADFALPVFITFLYFLLGMLYDTWHPLWLMYLAIPVYYPIAEAIDKALRK